MTLGTFWQLIDDTRNASGRLVEMPQILTEALCKLDEQEIVDFWSHHLDCLHRSYDARLWPELRNRNLISGDEEEARAMFPRLASRFPKGIRRERLG